MNTRAAGFAFAAVGIGALLLAWRKASASVAPVLDESDSESGNGAIDFSFFDTPDLIMFYAEENVMNWKKELETGRGAPYAALLFEAESRYALPPYLLCRLAWQESHFKPNAHNAKSNASGLMQIVPRWHPDVDPFNPSAAIPYAAKYLKSLFKQFGSWKLALMAYNWGPGNVSKWLKQGGAVPTETKNYQSQILADVTQFSPGGVAWA